jgi:hypothetical protein
MSIFSTIGENCSSIAHFLYNILSGQGSGADIIITKRIMIQQTKPDAYPIFIGMFDEKYSDLL